MATRNPLARGKRERERARGRKTEGKSGPSFRSGARRGQNSGDSGGIDPDIAGNVPGPQANPWGDENHPRRTSRKRQKTSSLGNIGLKSTSRKPEVRDNPR